jgi:hypothetical protein
MRDHRLYDIDIAVRIADMRSLFVDADENVPKEEEVFQKVEHERARGIIIFGRSVSKTPRYV